MVFKFLCCWHKSYIMPGELNEVQQSLIHKIAQENGFNKYEVTTNSGSKKGDNYLGIITAVTIKNDRNTLDLILKTVFHKEAQGTDETLRFAYVREIYLYTQVFNEFRKYQEKYNVADMFDNYAKIYGSSEDKDSECILMENLKTEGYQMWNKQKPMNSEHISAVLKGYAKFHGTCVAMKHKNPEYYEKLTKDISSSVWENEEFVSNTEQFKGYIKYTMDMGYKSVENDLTLTEFLKIVESKITDIFLNATKDPEYEVSLIHGDCWCNNILFKYEANGSKIRDMKIIDWQMSHKNSPAFDVCYFFLAHSPKEILDDYKTYMKLYYDTFSRHLRSFNCEPEECFPYSRFEKHLNRCMVIGLYMCFPIIRMMLLNSEEAPEIGENTPAMNLESFENFDLYKERIRNLIVFLKDNNFASN